MVQPGGTGDLRSHLDVEIGSVNGRDLRLDAWLPQGATNAAPRPGVLLLGGAADSSDDPMRRWPIYQSWMRTIADRGLVGMMSDADPSAITESHAAAFRFLSEHGNQFGVDPSRLAIVALSSNVRNAIPFAMADEAPAGLRAAVFLYGVGNAPAIRSDLPVLYVVAGRDSPALIGAEESLFEAARRAGAPWIFVHALDVPHAFDALDPSHNSRALVQQVLDFLVEHLRPTTGDETEPDRSARSGLAALYGRDFARARTIYEELSKGSGAADPLVWKNLAWACEGSGDMAATLAALDRALALDPEDRASHRAAGYAAARLGAWDRAERSLSRLEDVADAQLLDTLGIARLRLGRPKEAADVFAKALGAGGGVETRYNYACALALAGDRDAALVELERAVADGYLNPDLATDADLESLRAEPRFKALVAKMPAPTPEEDSDPAPKE